MKKVLEIIFSTKLMASAFIIFAVAMGIATFIENDFGTETAQKLIYNTWWFEVILLIFVINFFGNIFKYKLHKKEKWSILLFHLSFLFIIIGAGITRYFGYEGLMLINEKETSNIMLSTENYINLIVDDRSFQTEYNHEMLLSAWGHNKYEFQDIFKPKPYLPKRDISLKLVKFIPWVKKEFKEDKTKKKNLVLVETATGTRNDHYIPEGTTKNIHNILVGFNNPKNEATINIKEKDGKYTIFTRTGGNYMIMKSRTNGTVTKDSLQQFNRKSLYNISGLPFVVPGRAIVKGQEVSIRGKKDKTKFHEVVFDITVNGKTKRQSFTGGQYNVSNIQEFEFNGLHFKGWYGAKKKSLPFDVRLNKFKLEKYPGSESASAFESQVTVISPEEQFDYKIYMNHILDYQKYKLFQASYSEDSGTLKTHLSVNHDYWGTLVSYAGYFMLYFGLIVALFANGTRFAKLKKSLSKIKAKKAITSLAILVSLSCFSQEHRIIKPTIKIPDAQIDSILRANIVPKEHAESFSKLIIQDAGGRMKPVHTFASELVRKVAHTENFKEFTPSQIFISMIQNERFWFEVPFIYLGKTHNKEIRKMLNISPDAKFARFSDFLNEKGGYKIREAVISAQKSKVKNKFEKDLITVDKRVGLTSRALSGAILRIYPIPNDPNNKWVSHMEAAGSDAFKDTLAMIPRLLPTYLQTLISAKIKNDYSTPDKILEGIKLFQKKLGNKTIIPSDEKINAEITYNKLKIFTVCSYWYPTWGLGIILFYIIGIFYNKSKIITYTIKALIIATIITFIYHTFGLILRWYLSGNAPWSNAYESIIYVAWATMLFGLWFGRKSTLTIGATVFLAGMILIFANQNWLDPEIANLQPVLNSWWLMVHVSIIVASYGPFGLSMILGILVLLLTIFSNNKNKRKLDLNIKELTIINEMSMNVGLVMLTIGNFLGGMWANESWGRYWGWDPKETWALISIMVYAFVLHMRLVPVMKGRITFNAASAFAFLSVMMTYFGVNFYLSGLHSYASGDQVVTPKEAYIYIGVMVTLTILASRRHKKIFKK